MSTNPHSANVAVGLFHGDIHQAWMSHLKPLFTDQRNGACLSGNRAIMDKRGTEWSVRRPGSRVLRYAKRRGKHTTMDICVVCLPLLREGQNVR
jgi:hypothetical protein